jgi:hypothetical protein
MVSLQSKNRVYIGPSITRNVMNILPQHCIVYSYTKRGSIKIYINKYQRYSRIDLWHIKSLKNKHHGITTVDKDGAIRLTLPNKYNYKSVDIRKVKDVSNKAILSHIYIIPKK